jgi:hypothetical protein
MLSWQRVEFACGRSLDALILWYASQGIAIISHLNTAQRASIRNAAAAAVSIRGTSFYSNYFIIPARKKNVKVVKKYGSN